MVTSPRIYSGILDEKKMHNVRRLNVDGWLEKNRFIFGLKTDKFSPEERYQIWWTIISLSAHSLVRKHPRIHMRLSYMAMVSFLWGMGKTL